MADSDLSAEQRAILANFVRSGWLPDRPFLARGEEARVLMRRGLVELVDPSQVPGRSFVRITDAGRAALAAKSE